MLAYQKKWFPQSEVTTENLAQALFLENDSFDKNQAAINNGICLFFKDS